MYLFNSKRESEKAICLCNLNRRTAFGEAAKLDKNLETFLLSLQVWFQNARAKEKKAKLALQQAIGQEPKSPPLPDECSVCQYPYASKHNIQEHLFSKEHLDNVRLAVTEGRFEPESPGHVMAQAAAAIQGNEGLPGGPQGVLGPPPPPPEGGEEGGQQEAQRSASSPPSGSGDPGRKGEVEAALMQQIYGMGHGINSYPSGVAQANPFLHPAMFSASGESSPLRI